MHKNTLMYVGIGGVLAYLYFSSRTATPAAQAIQASNLNAQNQVANVNAVANLTNSLAQSADTIASFW